VRRLGVLVVVLGASVVSLAPGLARGDGDPASDVLLGANVFYPYNPPVSSSLQKALNAQTAAAAKAHFHLKVALIAGPYDLGVVPQMFGNPQQYADFLDQELRLFLGPHPPLLVVMSAGYGVQGLPQAAASAAASLPRPSGKQSNDLAKAAVAAVPKLAAAAGHPIAAADASDGGSGGGGITWTLIILALVAIAIAGGVLVARHRLTRRA
jgi:hypothetical protein